MAARETAYAESTGQSDNSTTTPSAKVTLNWTPGAASTDYLVIWSAQLRSSGTSVDAIVEFKDDAATVRGQSNTEPKDATDYYSVFGIWKYTSTGSPSAISFTLEYYTEGAATASIREARIFVMRMGADDEYAANDATDTETSTTFNSAVNLTFTPPSDGDYLLIGSAEMNFSVTSGEYIHKLTHGGTDYGTATVRPRDATGYDAAGLIVKKNLAASSQSMDWNFARSATAAGTASCRNSRIAAIRLSAFADNYYGEVRASRSTSTSTTFADYASVTDTPLAARSHLIIGSCVRDHNSTSNSALTKLRDGAGDLAVETTTEPEAASATIDTPAWAQMLVRTEAASSTTWNVAYATESAGTSTGIDEGAIFVLDLEEASANKVLDASAGSYVVTGTAASLEFGREVAADAGSYAVTGQAASLELGLEVAAGAGAYAVTGQAAALEFGRELAANAGAYSVTGSDAALILGSAKILAADLGSYAITGSDANLELGREIAAEAGSYAVTGSAADLEFSRLIAANVGGYVISGTDAELIYGGITPPAGAGGASSDYYPRSRREYPRRIMLPNRRIVQPKSYADYQRIVGEILAEAAPDAVEVTERPVAKRKTSRSIGRTEPEYMLDTRALAAVQMLMAISDQLSMEALIAELTGRAMVQMMEEDDEAAMIAILMELA